MSRDFHLPGRSPVDRLRRHGGDLASAGDAGRDRDAARRRQCGRRRGGRGRGAVRGRAAHDRHRRRLLLHAVARPASRSGATTAPAAPAPRASTEALLAQGIHAIAGNSIHAVTVPGAIDAWAAILKAHGRFGLERALAPAIRFAEGGFPVAPRVASDWAQLTGKLARRSGRGPPLPVRRRRARRRRRHPVARARARP